MNMSLILVFSFPLRMLFVASSQYAETINLPDLRRTQIVFTSGFFPATFTILQIYKFLKYIMKNIVFWPHKTRQLRAKPPNSLSFR